MSGKPGSANGRTSTLSSASAVVATRGGGFVSALTIRMPSHPSRSERARPKAVAVPPPPIHTVRIAGQGLPSAPMRVERCRVIELPRITDPRGNLTFVEGGRHVPFPIARVYYLYDVPGGESRGGHAHRRLEQLIVAI